MRNSKPKFVVVDTETTGLLMPSVASLEQQPRIIEIAIAVLQGNRVMKRYNQMVDPGCEIPEKITQITGISANDLVGAPRFADIVEDIAIHFKGATFFVAHNAVFDKGMIASELKRCGCEIEWPRETICSVQEYVPMFGHRPKLTTLYEHILGKPLAQTHRAIDDVNALIECLLADKFFERIAA